MAVEEGLPEGETRGGRRMRQNLCVSSSAFVIVIPVKGGAGAKSRLGGDATFRAALARAMALDTIEAALEVASVIVVTSDDLAADLAAVGVGVVPDPGEGLNAAIEAGLEAVPRGAASAVLLGDLPGLDPRELRAALEASVAERSFVADADGVGTVLTVARASHALRFGAGSRQAHLDAGYVELLEPWPSLRRDVDLPQHLEQLARGRRTLELLRER